MRYHYPLFALLGLFLLGLGACKKTPKFEPGTIKMQFNYVFGPAQIPFAMDNYYVHSNTGDSLSFNELRYYVSNVKLKKADGSTWAMPNSYHLVIAEGDQPSFLWLYEIPGGEYTGMEYSLGVDSLRATEGPYTGDLAPDKNMFWNVNDGFAAVKVGGESPQSNQGQGGNFEFHLGGDRGLYNVYTTKSINFPEPITVNANISNLRFRANVARFWHGGLSLTERGFFIGPGEPGSTMARNFFSDFTYLP